MRSLIEELGHTIVALIIASAILVLVVTNVVVPGVKSHVEKFVPEDVADTGSAFTEHFVRANPIITISAPITTYVGATYIDFDDYIYDGTIKAVNADGVDISSNIIIKAADDTTAQFYNELYKIFEGSGVVAGDYNFTLSVVDYTDEEYFGKVSEMNFAVSVTEPEVSPEEEIPED